MVDTNKRALIRPKVVKRSISVALIAFAALVWIVPVIWMFALALSSNDQLRTNTTSLVPLNPTLDNVIGVFQVGLMARWFLNSAIVTVLTTLFTLLLCSMAGFAFARLKFAGKNIVYPLVLAGLMIPKEAMFIPLFLMFADLNLHNTYIALILPRVANPLGVFIMTQFFKAIPYDLEEAASLDGASRWTVYWRVMLPMSRPALTALAIFTFVLTWNDYLWPLVSATNKEMFTVTTGLASLQGNYSQSTELGSLMARGAIASIPLLLIYVLFQRQLLRGISVASGGK